MLITGCKVHVQASAPKGRGTQRQWFSSKSQTLPLTLFFSSSSNFSVELPNALRIPLLTL